MLTKKLPWSLVFFFLFHIYLLLLLFSSFYLFDTYSKNLTHSHMITLFLHDLFFSIKVK